MTDYLRPASLDEALSARRDHPEFVVLAGGTDLMVGAGHRAEPPGVIDLFGLATLVGVHQGDDGTIVIGAATTHLQILGNILIAKSLPCLAAAAREIGALQIQARGTIGGNVGTSSPVGDSLPPLLALDAKIELASHAGWRVVDYSEFCTGYRTTVLRPDELIVAIHVPAPAAGTRQYWRKVGTRRAQSISKVMMAGVARVEDGVIAHARVALGAVAAQPIRATGVEGVLVGATPGPALADVARAALASGITPIDDVRSEAAYRMRVAGNLVARFVLSLEAE